jgi:hypothetical protein
VFQTQLLEAMREPGAANLLLLGGVSLLFVATIVWLRQRLRIGDDDAGSARQSAASAH